MWTDGHCHPTDTPESLEHIGATDCRMVCMSTRFDDIVLVAETARKFPDKVVPAFGLHPWYSHLLSLSLSTTKWDHYRSVLDPAPDPRDPILDWLPDPVLLSDHLNLIEAYLREFPTALLGEVGLDKAFRIKHGTNLSQFRVKLDHQRTVLQSQLALADNLGRSVSLHGVQAHQHLLDSVTPYKSGITGLCLHSYGGSSEFYVDHWLKIGIPVYVSVALLINGKMKPQKLKALLRGLEAQYVLSESDYHSAGPKQLELVKASVSIFQEHFGWSNEQAEHQLEQNFESFIANKKS